MNINPLNSKNIYTTIKSTISRNPMTSIAIAALGCGVALWTFTKLMPKAYNRASNLMSQNHPPAPEPIQVTAQLIEENNVSCDFIPGVTTVKEIVDTVNKESDNSYAMYANQGSKQIRLESNKVLTMDLFICSTFNPSPRWSEEDDIKLTSTFPECYWKPILAEIDPENNLSCAEIITRIETYVKSNQKKLTITPSPFYFTQRSVDYDYLPGKSTAQQVIDAFKESIPALKDKDWLLYQGDNVEPLNPNDLIEADHLIIKFSLRVESAELRSYRLADLSQINLFNPVATRDLNNYMNKSFPSRYHMRILINIMDKLPVIDQTATGILAYLNENPRAYALKPLFINSNNSNIGPKSLEYLPGISTVQDLLDEYREKCHLGPDVECRFFAAWISENDPLCSTDIITEDYKEHNSCLIITSPVT